MSMKIIALATVTALSTATLASANNSFAFGETLSDSTTVDLGTLNTTGAGMVEIYDFRGGEAGKLLGATEVHAGANQDVRINLNQNPQSTVVAVLTVNGQVVAEKDYRISDRM